MWGGKGLLRLEGCYGEWGLGCLFLFGPVVVLG